MRKYYPNYSIGTDAYSDIPMVCEKYGTKAVIIGGTHALATAADLIKEAVADSNIMITGVFEYGGEASREHIDELNSHQEVVDADMDAVITKALSGIDVRKWPYEVTPDMILDAVKKLKKFLSKKFSACSLFVNRHY